ncbi:MAG: CGNR zinc finger domain-containing protein [Candidatus Binataceae bacterium]
MDRAKLNSADHQRRSALETLDSVIVAPSRTLCLDFANTLSWRGSTPVECLRGFDELEGWFIEADILTTAAAKRLRRWALRYPARAAQILADTLALREVIYELFHAQASVGMPPDRQVDSLNRALDRAPRRGALARRGDKFGWQFTPRAIGAAELLAPVLWSAGDLLVSADANRVRECGNPQCLWLFLDDSKNGSRRWCSMQSCGNRAKAQRHYNVRRGLLSSAPPCST